MIYIEAFAILNIYFLGLNRKRDMKTDPEIIEMMTPKMEKI
jgi:hypothetical protein